MTQQTQGQGIMIASVAAALLAALAGSGDLAMGVAAFGQAAVMDQQLGFSRQAEQEADRVGLELMRKAGFDPRGMAQMFRQLMSTSGLNEGAGGNVYSSTHPLSIQRMSDIEGRIDEQKPVQHRDSDSFWYIRAKLRVIQAGGKVDRRAAQSALRHEADASSGVRASAAWFGLACFAWQQHDARAAQEALDNARRGGRDSPEIAGLSVDMALAAGGAGQALDMARAAWERWPLHQGTAMAMIKTLQSSGRDEDAVRFISERQKRWPDMAVLDQLQARSYEKLRRPVDARRSMARYYEKTGALPTAAEQLRQAREMSTDFYVKSELDVQIRNLKQRLESQRELLKRFRP